ncbi:MULTISPECIES: CBS domain-containing protein [Sphingomonas]|uniref:CBS domain-containing protein n=1 Tax=Sphingomonas kyungheensis TaxID=1069987 RepID=A0ABU8H4E0_9SPHN|nr:MULTISPECIES: CBS domain-containing protein [unclassified Sphingomonas]EZP49339.1 CBS domain-containing putative signal transduction protein [Sphingomonas sp. RIT328]
MTIAAILRDKGSEVVSLPSDATLGQAVRLLAERRIGAVPVIDDGTVVGIVSERDVVYSLARQGVAALDAPLAQVMTKPVQQVAPSEPVIGALSLMTRRRIRHLPVIDGARLAGFVSIGDLVKHRIDRIEAEAAAMRDYIQRG